MKGAVLALTVVIFHRIMLWCKRSSMRVKPSVPMVFKTAGGAIILRCHRVEFIIPRYHTGIKKILRI